MKNHQTRKKFLIHHKFQLKYSLGFASIVALTAVLFGYLAQNSIEKTLMGAIRTGAVDSPVISSLFEGQAAWISIHIFMLLSLLCLVLVILGVLATHRIAGPLFSLNRRMQETALGKYFEKPLQFRKTDEFQELAKSYNKLMSSLQSKRKQELQFVHDELKSILDNFQKSDKRDEEVHHLEETLHKIEKQLSMRSDYEGK
ncbi:MAG: hypothetical protein HYS98_03040 [Deltaproteobacteria bacterium]|nr:hypothetical protein [Deltaproteobacteria bacterium]